jgi:hypothetical protein
MGKLLDRAQLKLEDMEYRAKHKDGDDQDYESA